MDKQVKKMIEFQEHDKNRVYTRYLKELKLSDVLNKLTKHKRRWKDVEKIKLVRGEYYLIRRRHSDWIGEPVLASWKSDNGYDGWTECINIIDPKLNEGEAYASSGGVDLEVYV